MARTGARRFGWYTVAFCILQLFLAPAAPAEAQGPLLRAEAVIIVNSASGSYLDFEHYVRPYLDHFGIPYSLLDIANSPITADIADFALIVVGHRQLDVTHSHLDPAEEALLFNAVGAGAGFVNFDNDLSEDRIFPRYQFIHDIFNFGYDAATAGSGVSFPAGPLHFIADRHLPEEFMATGQMRLAGLTMPEGVTPVATSGGQAFIAAMTLGSGRAVQWGSYDWMSTSVRGPVYGFDDLIWRAFVWAARKPFVMQGMPPFLTMRVDDEMGGLEWLRIANEFGIKPWLGLFIDGIDDAESVELSEITNAGLATVAIHAFSGTSFFYFDHQRRISYPDSTVASFFSTGTAWHASRNIPISDYVLPHYYELGTNVFQGLADWGVEFIGTQQVPGQPYRTSWITNGPFRRYELGNSGATLPVYYGDFLTVPSRPEFDGRFFNCVTEIRDDAGYEWYPDLADVSGSIGRGTRQLKRALDGMELPTLFTHGYYVSNRWSPSAPDSWRAILQGITQNLQPYSPINVTMDYACRYIRATFSSNIVSAVYDPVSRQVAVTLNGTTDVPTQFFVFLDPGYNVLVDVPAFAGSAVISYSLPGPFNYKLFVPVVVRE